MGRWQPSPAFHPSHVASPNNTQLQHAGCSNVLIWLVTDIHDSFPKTHTHTLSRLYSIPPTPRLRQTMPRALEHTPILFSKQPFLSTAKRTTGTCACTYGYQLPRCVLGCHSSIPRACLLHEQPFGITKTRPLRPHGKNKDAASMRVNVGILLFVFVPFSSESGSRRSVA